MEVLGIAGVLLLIGAIGLVFIGRDWGKGKERLKQAEADKEAMRDYEKINSNSDIDHPMSRMRKKDK